MSVTGTVTIAKRTPSLNETGRWAWQGGRSGSGWRKRWELQIWGGLLRSAFGAGRNETRMRLTVTSYRLKLCDPDNLKGGMKVLVDALRRSGMLVDDSPEWLDFPEPAQVRVRHRHQQKTVVTLEALPGSPK